MRIDVITIFPEYLTPLGLSLVGKAQQSGILDIAVHDLRDWTTDRHRTVDDTPFGGGAGMVMRPDIWGRAIDDVLPAAAGAADVDSADVDSAAVDPAAPDNAAATVDPAAPDDAGSPDPDPGTVLVIPTPSGRTFTQRTAEELATARHLIFACGRYEGIDARVAEHYRSRGLPVRELSIGDYVLNGGEVAALAMIEAVGRLLPGVVGNPESLVEESHGAAGLLEYPVYTKPQSWAGLEVPGTLLSGHHSRIARWRRDQALRRTQKNRPDLIAAVSPDDLDENDLAVLADADDPGAGDL